MALSKSDIIVTENAPLNQTDWNNLARRCSNIWQSSFYDEVQLFFNNHSVYFQYYEGDKLLAGIKLYYFESKKLPAFIRSISSRVTQGSECLIAQTERENEATIIQLFEAKIEQWCVAKKANTFFHYSFYGESKRLLYLKQFAQIWESKIGIAQIDLRITENELWQNIHPKHRSEIIKAQKNNLSIEFSDDLNLFFTLLDQTYEHQKAHAPNKKFLRKEFDVLKKNNAAEIVFAKQNENYLCGALLYTYGEKSLYAFGGTSPNLSGAGQFLQWEIMKHLKQCAVQFYLLGETALERNSENLKFSEGITKFKMRFGAIQLPVSHHGFVRSPLQLKLWKILQKIFVRS